MELAAKSSFRIISLATKEEKAALKTVLFSDSNYKTGAIGSVIWSACGAPSSIAFAYSIDPSLVTIWTTGWSSSHFFTSLLLYDFARDRWAFDAVDHTSIPLSSFHCPIVNANHNWLFHGRELPLTDQIEKDIGTESWTILLRQPTGCLRTERKCDMLEKRS